MFRKDFNAKIIALIISISFLFTAPLYSYPESKDTMRVPVGLDKERSRFALYCAFYDKKIDKENSPLSKEAALRYLNDKRSNTILVLHKDTMETEILPKERVNTSQIEAGELEILKLKEDKRFKGRRYILVVTEKATGKLARGAKENYGLYYAQRYLGATIFNLYTAHKNILLAKAIMQMPTHNVVDLGANINPISKSGLLARLREEGLPTEVPYIALDLDRVFFDVESHSKAFPGEIYSREEAGLGVVGDAGKTPFQSGTADCIVCADVLEHLTDPQSAIKEFSRMLSSEGRLFIVVPTFYKLDEFNYKHIRRKRATSHLQFFKEGAVFSLLREEGFVIEEVYNFGYITAFPYLLWLNEDYVPQDGVTTEKEGVYKEILRILRGSISVRDAMLIDENIRSCDSLLKNNYIDLSEEVSGDVRHILYLCCEVIKFHPDYSTRADLQEVYAKVKGIVDQTLDDFSGSSVVRKLEVLKGRFEDPSFITYYAGNSLFIEARKASLSPSDRLENLIAYREGILITKDNPIDEIPKEALAAQGIEIEGELSVEIERDGQLFLERGLRLQGAFRISVPEKGRFTVTREGLVINQLFREPGKKSFIVFGDLHSDIVSFEVLSTRLKGLMGEDVEIYLAGDVGGKGDILELDMYTMLDKSGKLEKTIVGNKELEFLGAIWGEPYTMAIYWLHSFLGGDLETMGEIRQLPFFEYYDDNRMIDVLRSIELKLYYHQVNDEIAQHEKTDVINARAQKLREIHAFIEEYVKDPSVRDRFNFDNLQGWYELTKEEREVLKQLSIVFIVNPEYRRIAIEMLSKMKIYARIGDYLVTHSDYYADTEGNFLLNPENLAERYRHCTEAIITAIGSIEDRIGGGIAGEGAMYSVDAINSLYSLLGSIRGAAAELKKIHWDLTKCVIPGSIRDAFYQSKEIHEKKAFYTFDWDDARTVEELIYDLNEAMGSRIRRLMFGHYGKNYRPGERISFCDSHIIAIDTTPDRWKGAYFESRWGGFFAFPVEKYKVGFSAEEVEEWPPSSFGAGTCI